MRSRKRRTFDRQISPNLEARYRYRVQYTYRIALIVTNYYISTLTNVPDKILDSAYLIRNGC